MTEHQAQVCRSSTAALRGMILFPWYCLVDQMGLLAKLLLSLDYSLKLC
jgi:hypothetical protein